MPFRAQIESGSLLKFIKAPAPVHPQTKGGGFAGTGEGRQFVGGFDRPAAPLQLLAVELRVGPIFGPPAAHVGCGARTKPMIVARAPVIKVVAAGVLRIAAGGHAAGPGEVGDLILPKTRPRRVVDEFLVHRAGQFFVHVKLTGLQLLIERRVFLVDYFVAGQVFAAEGRGFRQGFAPDGHGLAGNGKHEIDVKVVKAGPAQRVERAENHVAGMHAAEPLKQVLVKRLDAHRDAVHAPVAQQLCLVGGDGGGVALHRPFGGGGKLVIPQACEDLLPLFQAEQGGRASAKKDRLRLQVRRDEVQLAQQGLNVAFNLGTVGGFGEEGAVFALVRAEGHVDIQAGDWRIGGVHRAATRGGGRK